MKDLYLLSEVLDPICDLFWFVNLPDYDEALDDLADRFRILGAEGDPRVLDACGVETEKVLVLSEECATFVRQ